MDREGLMLKNRKTRVMSVLVLACVLMFALLPTTAFAATKKTVKYAEYTTTTAAADKKAVTVKGGTTRLTYQKSSGFLKFKAKKTGWHKFTMSKVKGGKSRTSAYFSVLTLSHSLLDDFEGQSISPINAKTSGGTNTQLFLGANGHTWKSVTDKTFSQTSSRYGKIKLKKGQVVYIYFFNGTRAKTTATLSIK